MTRPSLSVGAVRLVRVLRAASAAWLLACGAFARDAHAGPAGANATNPAASALLRAGYELESATTGDLDHDGVGDLVLVGLRVPRPGDAERPRIVVVALRRPAGLRVVGQSDGVAHCFECGGVKGGEAAPTIDIDAKGVLSVSSWGGSSSTWSITHRFRIQGARTRVVLIGKDESDFNTLTGEAHATSENFLSGEATRSYTPPQNDPATFEPLPNPPSRRETRYRVAKARTPLEKVVSP